MAFAILGDNGQKRSIIPCRHDTFDVSALAKARCELCRLEK